MDQGTRTARSERAPAFSSAGSLLVMSNHVTWSKRSHLCVPSFCIWETDWFLCLWQKPPKAVQLQNEGIKQLSIGNYLTFKRKYSIRTGGLGQAVTLGMLLKEGSLCRMLTVSSRPSLVNVHILQHCAFQWRAIEPNEQLS